MSTDYDQRIRNMILEYDPQFIDEVPAILLEAKGKEAAYLQQLVNAYGPEPGGVTPVSDITVAPSVSILPGTSAFECRVRNMMIKYAPMLVYDAPEMVAGVVAGEEEALMEELTSKYGPEPTEAELRDAVGPTAADGEHCADFEARVRNMMLKYDPQFVNEAAEIAKTADKETVMQQLVNTYGPEPGSESDPETEPSSPLAEPRASENHVTKQSGSRRVRALIAKFESLE